MMNNQIIINKNVKFDTSNIGDYLVTKRGIEQLIDIDDSSSYTTKLLIDKKAFMLAYEKFILNKDGNDTEENM